MIKTVTLAEPEQKKKSVWKPLLLLVALTSICVSVFVYLVA